MRALGLTTGATIRISGKLLFVAPAHPADEAELPQVDVFLTGTQGLKRAPLEVGLVVVEGTTVGCDPEFMVLSNSGKLRDASLFFPHEGRLGSDGVLGELRPTPSTRSFEVVADLRSLIRELRRRKLRLSCSSSLNSVVAGFHLHFGTPKELLTYAPPNSIPFIQAVARAMDVFIGLPSLVRDPDDFRRRVGTSYGMPSDFRISDVTFEYRTAGGYNLRSPALAASLIDVGLLAYNDIISRASLFTHGWTKMSEFNRYEHFQEAYGLPPHAFVVACMKHADRRPAAELSEVSRACLNRLYNAARHKKSIDTLLTRAPVIDQVYENWE